MGALVGVVATILLGPAGFALVGATMAGIIGGAVGGALGGLGGWAAAGQHYGVLAGMFAAGAGMAGATHSWDSFAGGLAGGIAGAFAGNGIVNAYSQQFANFRGGNGFVSNATLAAQPGRGQTAQASDALSVKPFARRLSWTGRTASHEGWALSDGSPLVDFGPNGSGRLEMNVYKNIGVGTRTGAGSTYTETMSAFETGQLVYGAERTVSAQSLAEGMDNFQARFIDAGQKYQLLGRNSNFSADWYGMQSGMGPAVVPGTWTPGSISDDN